MCTKKQVPTPEDRIHSRSNTRAAVYLTIACVSILGIAFTSFFFRSDDSIFWFLYGWGFWISLVILVVSFLWLASITWIAVCDLQRQPFYRPTITVIAIMTTLIAVMLTSLLSRESDWTLFSFWLLGGGVIIAWQLLRFANRFPKDVRNTLRIVVRLTAIFVIAPTIILWLSNYLLNPLSHWHVFLPMLAKIFHLVWFATVSWVFICDWKGVQLLELTKLNVLTVAVWTCLVGALLYQIPTGYSAWLHSMKPMEAFGIVELLIIVLWILVRGAVLSAHRQLATVY